MAGQSRLPAPHHGLPPGSDDLETDKVPRRQRPAGNAPVLATEKVGPLAMPGLSAISLPEPQRSRAVTPAPARLPIGTIVPWALLMAVALGAAFGIYYVYQKYEMARDELVEATQTAAAARQRVTGADTRLMELEAELSRVRGEFAAARKRAGERVGEGLVEKLEQLIPPGRGELDIGSGGRLELALDEAAVFVPGTDKLSDRGRAFLQQLGGVLDEFPGEQVWVYSHAASAAPAGAQSTLSWELSSRRALSAVYHLQNQASIDPERLAIVAFGARRAGSRGSASRDGRIEFALFPRDAR